MSASLQIALWGAAACAPVVLAYAMHKLPAMGLATMLLLGWCMGRVFGMIYTPPESMAFYPVIDLLFAGLAFWSWRQERAAWKLVLVGLFGGQLAAHSAFWLAYTTDAQSGQLLYRYVFTNNVLFALELLTVSWAGGIGELAGRARDWVSRGFRAGDHAGASG